MASAIFPSSKKPAPLIETLRHLDLEPPSPDRLSFLGLPAEVRLRVYDFLPVPDTSALRPARNEIEDNASSSNQLINHLLDQMANNFTLARRTPFAILYTSKQIYREALPILYGSTAVRAQDLRNLPAHVLPYVRTVLISCVYDEESMRWRCTPALKPVGPARDWPLENMWRYLGRAFPKVQRVRVRMVWIGLRDESELVEEASNGGAAGDVEVGVSMPRLESVVLEAENGPRELDAEKQAAGWKRWEALRSKVARLSKGALIVVDEGSGWA